MRRLALLGTVTLLATSGAQAQTGVSIGFKGGLNFAQASAEESGVSVDFSNRTAPAFGIAFGINPSRNFSVQPELLYSARGGSLDFLGIGSATLELNYLEVPLLFRAMIPNSQGTFTPLFFAGPVASVEISCNLSAESQGSSASEDCSVSGLDDMIKDFDFGLLAGAGFEAMVSPRVGITGEVRYNLGLSNLDDTNSSDTLRSRTVSALVGFVIRLPGA